MAGSTKILIRVIFTYICIYVKITTHICILTYIYVYIFTMKLIILVIYVYMHMVMPDIHIVLKKQSTENVEG